MANEFKVKNGLIVDQGGATITGSVIATGGFTGSLQGTSSWATNALTASFLSGTVTSASYALTASYLAGSIASASYAATASFVALAQSASYVLNSVSSSYALTASFVQNAQTASYVLNAVSASFATLAQTANTASYVVTAQTASYVLNAVSASFATLAQTANTASYVVTAQTASFVTTSSFAQSASNAINAQTASYLNTLNQNLTFNGNLTLNGTASISYLNVNYESASVIYSSGSNQFGDAPNDTQTLYGSVIVPTGSLTVTGSVIATSFTGSFSGSVAAPGSTTQIVYNNSGVLGADNGLVYSGSSLGIGSPSPQSGFRLDVTGNSVLRGELYTSRSFIDFSPQAAWNLNPSGFSWIARTQNLSVGVSSSLSAKLGVRGTGTTSATTALRVENTNASASLVVLDNGQVGIGTASPSSSISLDVSGSIRATAIVPTTDLTHNIGTTALRYNGVFSRVLSAHTSTLDLIGFNIRLMDFAGVTRAMLSSSNNFLIGTTTDAGYRLDVSGSGRFTDGLTVTGSLIATSFTGSLQGTASWATSASQAVTASYVLNAISSSFATLAQTANTASYVVTAQTASYVLQAVSASFATLAQTANTASYVLNAVSASFATTASYVTGSIHNSTNPALSASYALSSSQAANASNALTASYVVTAQTASYVLQAVSASFATLAQTANTASYYGGNVTSASFASTASYVNTLNQNVIITGSATIGTSSLGPFENTLTLGARDTTSEGGQIGFNAPGGTYTSASFIDNWQNKTRILKGTNAGSNALIAQWDIHTTQLQLPAYTAASSFVGTATANLAVDSSGNVITVSTAGGSVFPYTGNAVITGSLTVTQPVYIPINGNMYLQGGDDAALYDVNIVNTMGIYGVQDVTVGAVKLGSNGPVLYGSGSRLGIGTTAPTSASLTVNGNVWATSFTGSFTGSLVGALTGTASFADRATSSSRADTASFVTTAQTASYVLQAVSASFASTASFVATASWAQSASQAVSASRAISSSFALTSSYVNTLRQDVTISGSLFVSSSILGSGSTYNTTIDLQSAVISTNNTNSIAYGTKYLLDDASVRAVHWNSRLLTDSVNSVSVNWSTRRLLSGSTTVLDWSSGTGSLFGTATNASTASYSTKLGANLVTSSIGGLALRSSDNTVLTQFTTFTSSLALTASLVNTTKATAPNNGLHYLALVTQSGADASAREVRWSTNIYADPTTSTMYTGRLIATSVSASLTGSLTGALTGTASYATQALSASWAPSVASNPFPFTGSAIVSGSSIITGSLQVGIPGTNAATIDTTVGTLGRGSSVSVDWPNRTLYDSLGVSSIDWENRSINDPTNTFTALGFSDSNYTFSDLYHRAIIQSPTQQNIADIPTYSGQVIEASVDTLVADFDLVFLDTDGIWYAAKNTTVTRASNMLGICVDVASGYVLIEGDIGVSDDDSQGAYVINADHGLTVYIDATDGQMTATQPTSGVVRSLGHIYYQSTNTANWWTMKFRPSNDWYLI